MSDPRVSLDDCWLYAGSISDSGYGRVYVGKQYSKNGSVSAHRLMYEAVKGEIPEGLFIDHLCEVRNCVNPDHLEAVTNQVNVARGLRKFRLTHCRSGRHELTPDNLYKALNCYGTIMRSCKKCKLEKDRIRYLANLKGKET